MPIHGFLRFPGYGALSALRNLSLAIWVTLLPASAETVTIAALGDSLTQGYGLVPEDGFTEQLETWLRERGADIEVVNAGVSGDTTAGGLSRIEWTLTPDIDALIVALGGNDVLRGLDPAVSRANLEGIAQVATDRGIPFLIAGVSAPANYGPEYKRDFEAIFPAIAEEHDAVLVLNFLGAIEALPDRGAALETYMQADGIHPNRAGVELVVKAIGPEIETLVSRVK